MVLNSANSLNQVVIFMDKQTHRHHCFVQVDIYINSNVVNY